LENGKQSKLTGKIILADFLEYPLEKFMTFVQVVEAQPLYKKLIHEGIIIRKSLSDAKILKEENDIVCSGDGVIAKIKKDFSVHYTNEEFSIEYMVDEEKLRGIINDVKLTEEEKKNIRRLLHKLRRISTRNMITHEILKGIVEYQREYFESNSETLNENKLDLKLKPLQRAELARTFSNPDCKESNHSFVIDTSRISRVTQGLSIITPQGNEVSLKSLFPTKRDMVKRCIKVILNKEKEDIRNGSVKKPYTDGELRRKLKGEYDISITRREVAYCRNDLGILPSSERVNSYGYPPLMANFSKIYPFTSQSVKSNAPARPGVYELRVDDDRIEYPGGCCQTFYIGSAKNLRKRLLDHLSPGSKNGGIKRFVTEKSCAFRYLQVSKEWIQEEKNFYNLFITTYGDSPVCNHVSPKASENNF
jgi:RNA polymerase sigma-54 factor